MPPSHRGPRASEAPPLDAARAAAGPGERRFAVALTLAFAVLVAFGLASHEMWRDELQAWMLARDSATPGALLRNMRHEGHPPLWHLMLFAIARLTRDPAAMQVLHWLIATATAFVVARWAPFRRRDRALLVFGYFLAYEYAVVSRPYGLGALLLFAACALVAARRRPRRWHPVALAAALALLANTTVYGLLLAAALVGALLVERVVTPAARASASRRGRTLLLAAVVVAAVGGAVYVGGRRVADAPLPLRGAIRSVDGPADAVARLSSVVLRAWVPLPDPRVRAAWSRPLLRDVDGGRWRVAAVGLAVLLCAAAALAVAPSPLALAFLVGGTGVHLLVSYLLLFGTVRHHGNVFLVLVAALWLARVDGAPWRLPPLVARLRARAAPAGPLALTTLLALHLPATAQMYAADARRPFSGSHDVADHLRGLGDVPIAVVPSPAGSTVAGWLDRPVHFVEEGIVGTFVDWGRQADVPRPSDEALERVCALAEDSGGAVLVTVRPLERAPSCLPAIPPAVRFDAILGSERFHVYRIPAGRSGADGAGGPPASGAAPRSP